MSIAKQCYFYFFVVFLAADFFAAGFLSVDFVTALATRVEEDLAKSYPEIDFDYQKTLSNMNKTMKEMGKFKRINQL